MMRYLPRRKLAAAVQVYSVIELSLMDSELLTRQPWLGEVPSSGGSDDEKLTPPSTGSNTIAGPYRVSGCRRDHSAVGLLMSALFFLPSL